MTILLYPDELPVDPRDYFWCDFSDLFPHMKWDKLITDAGNRD
jgi:hypothetical protein